MAVFCALERYRHGRVHGPCPNCYVGAMGFDSYLLHSIDTCVSRLPPATTDMPDRCLLTGLESDDKLPFPSYELAVASLRHTAKWGGTHGACRRCWLSYTLHPPGNSPCTDPDLILLLCISAWVHLRETLVTHFDLPLDTSFDQYGAWLTQRVPHLPPSPKEIYEVFGKDLIVCWLDDRRCTSVEQPLDIVPADSLWAQR